METRASVWEVRLGRLWRILADFDISTNHHATFVRVNKPLTVLFPIPIAYRSKFSGQVFFPITVNGAVNNNGKLFSSISADQVEL